MFAYDFLLTTLYKTVLIESKLDLQNPFMSEEKEIEVGPTQSKQLSAWDSSDISDEESSSFDLK